MSKKHGFVSKHMVVCPECGRRFNASYGAYYDKSTHRYTCPSCIRKHNAAVRSRQADNREKATGMRQSIGVMILKIIIGLFLLMTGFVTPDSGWSVGYFVLTGVPGIALILWGILPFVNAKRRAVEVKAAEDQSEIERLNELKTCKSCGATGRGKFCEYCGMKYD